MESNAIKRIIVVMILLMLISTTTMNSVAAEYFICTIEDSGSNVTLNDDDSFIFSVIAFAGVPYTWEYSSSNSSILKLVSWSHEYFVENPNPGAPYYQNWTFEGAEKGKTTLKFIYWEYWIGNESIKETVFFNVTSNISRTTNTLLIITVFSIIIVVPSAIIIKRMRDEKD